MGNLKSEGANGRTAGNEAVWSGIGRGVAECGAAWRGAGLGGSRELFVENGARRLAVGLGRGELGRRCPARSPLPLDVPESCTNAIGTYAKTPSTLIQRVAQM